jgi:surface-anchored protein
LSLQLSYTEEAALDEVLIYGGPDGYVMRPEGESYDFLGVPAAQSLYIWPQSGSTLAVPELGIGGSGIEGGTLASYENSALMDTLGAWVEVRMVDLRGPDDASFSVFDVGQSGVTALLTSSDGIVESDALYILEGSHQHFSFAFTKPGVYEVDLVASGYRDHNGNGLYDAAVDPYVESGIETVYFAVDLPGGPEPYTIAAGMGARQ